MSDRRENIKRTLGISEYPWSSDDEEASPPAQASSSSLSDLSVMQRLLRRQQSSSQPAAMTSTPNAPVAPQPGSSQSPAQVAVAAAAAVRKSQASRADRNLFWSMLCNPNRGQADPLSRIPRVTADSKRRDAARVAASVIRRPDSLLRRTSPLREIRGILALKKAAARNLTNHRASLSFPNLSSTLFNPATPRSVSQGQPSRNPIFTPCSATATLEANLRAIRSRRIYNERTARAAGQAIPSTSGVGRSGEAAPATTATTASPRNCSGHQYHTAPSPSRAGDHRDGDSLVRSLVLDDSDVEMESPRNKEKSDQSGSIVTISDSPRVTAEISLEEEVLEVEPAVEATEAGTACQQGNEDAKQGSGQAEAAPSGEARGVKKKKDAKEDSVKELNQCLLGLLECPVCLEWMEPPMSQCRRGHLVCVTCRSRLSACPVCRTAFSSVRNRAMEEVAEMLRYPCRHGCGREVRLRRRTTHEASCARRRYPCPAPACAQRAPLDHSELAPHFQSKHLTMLKVGRKQKFSVKVNAEQHDTWLVLALHEIFHLRIDVDIRTWGIAVSAAYIGPRNNAKSFIYEVTVVGNHKMRKLVYARATHSDLESASINFSRQDCFHLSLDQALNFLRRKNRNCENENALTINVAFCKNEVEFERDDSGDS